VLVPAALENVITEENAARIRAKLIVEGANGPTSPQADHLLHAAGVTVIPDIIANAGGVIVSYFEWVQDRQGYFWRESEVNERLAEQLLSNFRMVREVALARTLPYRTAAYVVAIDRVTRSLRTRGVYA
jgi:glutamate dehydrogenase (NAD(P)+)